jgi:hypothetical protein
MTSRKEYTEPLAAPAPPRDHATDLWGEVHEEFQAHLAPLEAQLRSRVREIAVTQGRTRGESFLLFSYRKFSLPGSQLDPLVVGVTFTAADHGVVAEADASGEERGDLIVSLPAASVPQAREQLLAVARDCAGKLCQSAGIIAAALMDQLRRLD